MPADSVQEVFLNPGDFHFAGGHTRIRTLLGSCVSIALWHPERKLGGMCHFILPERGQPAAGQELDGRYKIFTGFAGQERDMAEFASRFAKMDVNGMDEVARDALGEFMNVQNGLFLSKLSNDWVELELVPSEFKRDGSLVSIGVVYKIPFTLPFGEFTFFIGLGSPVFN